jgi:peptidoglycan-N-acetylglucosamine deacetylase
MSALKYSIIICVLVYSTGLPAQTPDNGNDKTVVLTFDDACKSHYTIVAPLLKRYGFGATFFVCEFPHNFGDTTKSMTWGQIQQLSAMGFEIGNHTWHHRNVDKLTAGELNTELTYIEEKCDSLGIPRPVNFAYPAYVTDSAALPVLRLHGYLTARGGGDRAYDMETDDPLYVPSYTIKGEDRDYFYHAVAQAEKNKVVIFTIHGVPDEAHPWVSTPPAIFAEYLQYLYDHHYHVIAMRDLHVLK